MMAHLSKEDPGWTATILKKNEGSGLKSMMMDHLSKEDPGWIMMIQKKNECLDLISVMMGHLSKEDPGWTVMIFLMTPKMVGRIFHVICFRVTTIYQTIRTFQETFFQATTIYQITGHIFQEIYFQAATIYQICGARRHETGHPGARHSTIPLTFRIRHWGAPSRRTRESCITPKTLRATTPL